MKNNIKNNLTALVYIAPAFLFMFVFIFIPIIDSVRMSFYKIDGLGDTWTFIGFNNFKYILKENDLIGAFLRTLGFGAFGVVTGLFFGLLLAMLVANDKHINFYRYIFYIPGVVSSVTMGMLYSQMLDSTEFGMFNIILTKLGVIDKPFAYLDSEKYTWIIVLLIGLIGCGGGMTLILFTTAINDISDEIKESAILEGATNFQLNMKIILPLIKPTLFSWILLSIIGSLKSFEFIYSLTSGGPSNTTTTLAILLFSNPKRGIYGYGYSSALGLFMSVIVLIFAGSYYFLGNRKSNLED